MKHLTFIMFLTRINTIGIIIFSLISIFGVCGGVHELYQGYQNLNAPKAIKVKPKINGSEFDADAYLNNNPQLPGEAETDKFLANYSQGQVEIDDGRFILLCSLLLMPAYILITCTIAWIFTGKFRINHSFPQKMAHP